MKTSFYKLVVTGFMLFIGIGIGSTNSRPLNQAETLDAKNQPLYFIPNHGQFNEQVAYCARAAGYTLWITAGGITFDSSIQENSAITVNSKKLDLSSKKEGQQPISSTRQVLRTSFSGTNKSMRMAPLDVTDFHVNFFIGKDRSEWRTGIPTSRAVLYQDIYPKIDLKVYGMENENIYEFIIKPGGDVLNIKLKYEGHGAAILAGEGNLTFETGQYSLQYKHPSGFLHSGESEQAIDVKFRQTGTDSFGFYVDQYDGGKELVIKQDVAIFFAEAGVGSFDMGNKIAVDSSGGVYITGRTKSIDFPVKNSQGRVFSGGDDVFVTKLNASGTALIYSTYLGGIFCDYGKGLSVDSNGAVYVTGITNSSDFPTSNALYDHSSGGFDAFIAKLDPSGSKLIYSTFLGGSSDESGQSLSVDETGSVCAVGWTQSDDFPTQNAYSDRLSGKRDVFVTKIDPSGKAFLFSTYLGGASLDFGKDISLGISGTIWVTGYTGSYDFPVKDAIFPELSGKLDAFITQLDASGSALVFSTYLGGSSNDIGNAISKESKGSVFLTGYTNSGNFPIKNALDETLSGKGDAFVTKINTSTKSLVYSTFLGGSSEDSSCDIEIDSMGSVFLTGYTYSEDFPASNSHSGRLSGDRDAFVAKINASGATLVYSTYLGGNSSDYGKGIAVDQWGSAYVTGNTSSSDFPTQNAFNQFLSGRDDAFITKFNAEGTKLIYCTYLGGSKGFPLYKLKLQNP
ncbi:MAG: SBBP repeat-containing protein [Candidatus Aminicenantes bacterium]|nr:SBBP repeat-containing protein [Candidatus Aminicenantes bacterium]